MLRKSIPNPLTPPFMAGLALKQTTLALATIGASNGLKPKYFVLFVHPRHKCRGYF
jgi:hypothetical protein